LEELEEPEFGLVVRAESALRVEVAARAEVS
jgi:hypothetical protein